MKKKMSHGTTQYLLCTHHHNYLDSVLTILYILYEIPFKYSGRHIMYNKYNIFELTHPRQNNIFIFNNVYENIFYTVYNYIHVL